MHVQDQIAAYIAAQPEPKRTDLQTLHDRILAILPDAKTWFLDGRDDSGKIVSNPNIGFGARLIRYADGKTREFYRIGLSANTSGISVYILGIEDKNHLAATYGATLGKAKVTGYCIRFKALKDIDPAVLEAAIRYGAALD
jgi:hypothetical protein